MSGLQLHNFDPINILHDVYIFQISVRSAAAAAVTIAVTMMLMMPAPPAIGAGGAPPGSPAPGSPGGGGSPNVVGNPVAASAVALVPAGLTAVAVFPPFETPRTLPAIAVIFSEESTRRKRETYSSKQSYHHNAYTYTKNKISSILDDILWKLTALWNEISECKYFPKLGLKPN